MRKLKLQMHLSLDNYVNMEKAGKDFKWDNQKLNVTVGLNDVLYKDYFRYTTTYSDQSFYFKDRGDSRRVRFSITYRFGKMKIDQRLKAEAEQMNR